MFDARSSFLGVPADVAVMAVGIVLAVVGLLWLRRILTIEPEVRSFRATAGRGRPWVEIAGVLVAIGLVALAVVLFVR